MPRLFIQLRTHTDGVVFPSLEEDQTDEIVEIEMV